MTGLLWVVGEGIGLHHELIESVCENLLGIMLGEMNENDTFDLILR